jgi:hypothetical protein
MENNTDQVQKTHRNAERHFGGNFSLLKKELLGRLRRTRRGACVQPSPLLPRRPLLSTLLIIHPIQTPEWKLTFVYTHTHTHTHKTTRSQTTPKVTPLLSCLFFLGAHGFSMACTCGENLWDRAKNVIAQTRSRLAEPQTRTTIVKQHHAEQTCFPVSSIV